jgi:hypothetical protein
MAKKTNEDVELEISTNGKTITTSLSKIEKAAELLKKANEQSKPYEITAAAIRDGYCDYTLVVKKGQGIGTHKIKGEGLITDDLRNVFAKLNVHLAIVDDIFKHSGFEFDTISEVENSEFANLYDVVGITLKGEDENLSCVLKGTKYVSQTGGERQHIDSAKIHIGSGAFYKWYNELNETINEVKQEVEAYHNGKYTLPESLVEDTNQLSIEEEELA